MNFNCIICTELFTPTSCIFTTKCGHIFHYTCLIQWIERSKTCPQCRNKNTEKTINRVFFNIVNSDTITDDAVTLQSKLDSINLQLRLKENHVKTTEDQIKVVTEEKDKLQVKLEDYKDAIIKCRTNTSALKDQVNYYRDKAKYVEKVEVEIKELKAKLKLVEDVSTSIEGSVDDFNNVVMSSTCPKTLGSIANSLKKELLRMVQKRNMCSKNLQKTESELKLIRSKFNDVNDENAMLKAELVAHNQCEAEMSALRNRIVELIAKQNVREIVDTNLKRIAMESPAPMLTKPKPKLNFNDVSFCQIDSPTVSARMKEIKFSKSPYLATKASSMTQFLHKANTGAVPKYGTQSTSSGSIFNVGKAPNKPTTSGTTLFKKSSSASKIVKYSSQSKSVGIFNGLGAQATPDKYPEPRPNGIKRTKPSTSGSTSSKMRKLDELMNNNLDDFLSITDSLEEYC